MEQFKRRQGCGYGRKVGAKERVKRNKHQARHKIFVYDGVLPLKHTRTMVYHL